MYVWIFVYGYTNLYANVQIYITKLIMLLILLVTSMLRLFHVPFHSSGGRLILAMCETYLRGKIEFFKNLEPTMKRHEDEGLWRMVERKIVPKYLENDNGLVFIFEVLWKGQPNGCKTTQATLA